MSHNTAEWDALIAEVERLHDAIAGHVRQKADMYVEAVKYRDALREIAAGHPDGGPWSGGAERIAKAALDG